MLSEILKWNKNLSVEKIFDLVNVLFQLESDKTVYTIFNTKTGEFEAVGAGCKKVLGYTPNQMIGVNYKVFLYYPHIDVKRDDKAIESNIESDGGLIKYVNTYRTMDSRPIDLYWESTKIKENLCIAVCQPATKEEVRKYGGEKPFQITI